MKIMMTSQLLLGMGFAMSIGLFTHPVSSAELLISPLPTNSPQAKKLPTSPVKNSDSHTKGDYVIHKGRVTMTIPTDYLSRAFILQLPDDTLTEVTFTRQNRNQEALSLWGKTKGSEVFNATMTVGNKNYFIIINDLENKQTINISGNINSNVGVFERYNNTIYRSHLVHAPSEAFKSFDYRTPPPNTLSKQTER